MLIRKLGSQRSVKLQAYAACMRRHPWPLEVRLWNELSGSKLGASFRRQQVLLGRFIVDFLAPQAKVVVEVDGAHHLRQRRADARRDRVLESAGYRILRFTAEEVRQRLSSVLERIRTALKEP